MSKLIRQALEVPPSLVDFKVRDMSDQHSQRAASLEARLTDVKMEIDDDDEDVILVTHISHLEVH